MEPCHSFSDCLIVSRVNFPFVSSMQSWETILSSSPCSFGFNIPTNHLAKQSPDRSATNLLEFFTCGTCCLHSGQWNSNPAFSTGSMLISDTCQTQTRNFENMSMCIWLHTKNDHKIINIHHVYWKHIKYISIIFDQPENREIRRFPCTN